MEPAAWPKLSLPGWRENACDWLSWRTSNCELAQPERRWEGENLSRCRLPQGGQHGITEIPGPLLIFLEISSAETNLARRLYDGATERLPSKHRLEGRCCAPELLTPLRLRIS